MGRCKNLFDTCADAMYIASEQQMMQMNMPLKLAILESRRSQIAIAKAARIHESKLSRIIRGHDEPTDAEKKAIARALRRKVDDVFPSHDEAVA